MLSVQGIRRKWAVRDGAETLVNGEGVEAWVMTPARSSCHWFVSGAIVVPRPSQTWTGDARSSGSAHDLG